MWTLWINSIDKTFALVFTDTCLGCLVYMNCTPQYFVRTRAQKQIWAHSHVQFCFEQKFPAPGHLLPHFPFLPDLGSGCRTPEYLGIIAPELLFLLIDELYVCLQAWTPSWSTLDASFATCQQIKCCVFSK